MKDREIINLSKSIFGICLTIGSICLLGGLFKNESFAVAGYLLLLFATPINLLFVITFLIGGLVNRSRLRIYVKAIGILSINIPIAALYSIIGLYLFSDGHW
ncbi:MULTISPECIES: hypothetical protein [Chryseobacterium]|uniref:LIVCS family branched-chain amino acid:cation transporter n=1 Tax=Chryseobacterium nakagawai TaxID=1241982 RepID=A0AAD0YPI7_CHRNA|nr:MULTISPECIES: hypothetical protein [Chryseobacterium]AZA92233.1 hypothetical protein EG343_17230 [Chryseobacterium nakagawai]VEH18782.1 Uncharacterised protein [Chryseobacterium nakagawai]